MQLTSQRCVILFLSVCQCLLTLLLCDLRLQTKYSSLLNYYIYIFFWQIKVDLALNLSSKLVCRSYFKMQLCGFRSDLVLCCCAIWYNVWYETELEACLKISTIIRHCATGLNPSFPILSVALKHEQEKGKHSC